MTILLVQTFLLMLGAFLLGTSLACIVRRAFSGRSAATLPTSAPHLSTLAAGDAAAPVAAGDAARFGRALAGAHGPAEIPTGPVVEVQPRPPVRVAPLLPPSEPAPPPAPEPPPAPPPEPPRSDVSYTQIAVAAAAGVAAAAAAARRTASDAEEAPPPPVPEPEPVPESPDRFGQSYTEIAVAAAGAAAAAAAAAADGAASRFGTPVPSDAVPLPPSTGVEGDDLTRIHSIDVAVRERLNRLGVTRFAEIGAWTASDVIRFSQSLGVVPGRIEQENWVGQAQILAAGGVTDGGRWRGPELMPRIAPLADGDRLNRIIGVDPDSESLLRANGVMHLSDIAAWTDADVARFEGLLGAPGRIGRENWVEQARFLTRGTGVAAAIETISAPAEPPASPPDAAPSSPPSFADLRRGEGYAGLRSVRSEALKGDRAGLVLPPTGEVDDLKRIRGIGVLIEKKLHSLGITSYEQVANWTGDDIERVSRLLDFAGRIERENWIEQARILASGGQTEFSRRVDRGDV